MILFLKYLILLLFFVNQGVYAYQNSLKNVTLKSASEFDYPPFSIVLDNGQADGFSVELLKNSVEEVGGKIEFRVDKWETIKQELKDGKIDILPVVGRTNERKKYFDFTIPYLTMHGAVFTRENDTRIKTFEDLEDKVVVVMKGDNAEEYVRENNIGKKIVTFDTYNLAFEALSSGKHDAIIIQKLVGIKLLKTSGLKNIKVSNFILENFRQDFSFAVQKGNHSLLSLLNEGLSISMANGTYNRLYEKWFHDAEENPFYVSKTFKFLVSGLVALFIALIFYLYWNRLLQIKVSKKTRELAELNETLEKRIQEAISDLYKKDEIMLIQSRQAIIGEMISMIAHQWRQPIANISMIANKILVDIYLENFDLIELEKMAEHINKNTQELSKTIDDFRNFFKPNKEIETIKISTIVKDTISIVGKSLENRNIVIEVIKNDDILEIKTYPRELMQVFINILNNAKDAFIERNTSNPTISISAEQSSEHSIIIKICDNAGGINETIIEKIFDPYFSTKNEKNGTGLGLYMSKMIIEKHLIGTINVFLENGGTCFKIGLPDSIVDKVE